MIFLDKQLFLKQLPSNGKLLSIDFGKKRIGFATADLNNKITFPQKQLIRTNLKADVLYIQTIVKTNDIKGIIMGWALSMDGSKNKITQAIEQFAKDILKSFDIPIYFQDERLSSFMADILIEEEESIFGKNAIKKNKAKTDSLAAKIILDDFLR